ncbi:MAG: M23 family metallopeptidase [Verrucomicrobia bacterium]|nr:M23 family metallopeptidase [Verrucomicrobiota bacterium]
MKEFSALPNSIKLEVAYPTPNHNLKERPELFFARTRANPDYGKPGWTRDCGRRFHKGCDIASVVFTPTGKTTKVMFSDCKTDTEYESTEPTFIPSDRVFAAYEGDVIEAVTNQRKSDYGKHVVIRHLHPESRTVFFTLYGHLSEVLAREGESISTGQRIGTMGTTSRIANARNWMSVAPHLHFEVWDSTRKNVDPVQFLRRFTVD